MSSARPVSESVPLFGDRYEVTSSIGSGASANVFRVRDVRSGAVRAAKVLRPGNAANAGILARFEDEFRILRTLHHPHLPEVYDYGWTDDGGRFLVMELVDGEPLDRYFQTHPEDIWVVLYQLCEVLVFVHARNLLHQDIKPSNILVTRVHAPEGERPLIKLIDFGLTHRRGADAAVKLVGTAEYIAPEVIRGERALTRAVDYYSLGATLFELLCGAPPFTGSESEVLRAHLDREPVIEQEELEWAELYPHVKALLAKNVQTRLAAFEEFRRAVVGRLTGGIDDLDRAYALARIDSLGMIGKKEAWGALLDWLAGVDAKAAPSAHTVSLSGSEGVGKRFLVSALRAEAAMRGIRTLAPADIDAPRFEWAVARQPSLMWARLLEACEKEPVVLVVERPELLPDEERSFVRLAGTQWELTRSRGRVLPLYFLVAVDANSDDADVLDYLPSENALKLELASLSAEERDEVVAQFRGSMFDSRDARSLVTYLGRFDDVGGGIQALQRAVLRSALTFAGQRWKVQPSLLTETVGSRPGESFSRELVASLSPLDRRIAAIVAAHPDPVPLSWVAAFVETDPVAVLSIVGSSMKRLCVVSSERVSPATASIREVLRSGCDANEMRRAHEFLAERLAGLDRSVVTDRALAHHYESLGRVRETARVHLRLLHAYWTTRPRERPYELIEGVCRAGLELIEANGSTVSATTRRHLFCFYLKEWIKALWARNLFTQAKGIVDEWTTRLGEEMPSSLAPKYVRSVLESDGPTRALSCLDRLARAQDSRQLRGRFALERSLCLHQAGEYELALVELATISPAEPLEVRDWYRFEIYRSMNLAETGEVKESTALIIPLVERASHDGFADEALLMRALIARSLLEGGNSKSSLSAVSVGLRLARTAGLQYRANLMYRLAATAYTELGDIRRAKRCQERAIQIADELGIRDIAGLSWSRLATNERRVGRYGNALRYYEKALAILGEHGPAWSRTQTHVALYGLLVVMQSEKAPEKAVELGRRLRRSEEHNALGFYRCWRGLELEHSGKSSVALREFQRGKKEFELAGNRSNTAWALALIVRTHLSLGQLRVAFRLLQLAAAEVAKSGSSEAAFELTVVNLRASYIARSPWRMVNRFVEECERELKRDQLATLKIEALQLLFRVYSRRQMTDEANDAFHRFRSLVLEMSSNVNDDQVGGVAEAAATRDLINEIGLLSRRPTAQEKGAPPSRAPGRS